VHRQFKKILQILFVLFLFAGIFLTQSIHANQTVDSEKSQAETQLEKIKSDREVYESQVSDLEEKFINFDTKLKDLEAQQQKIDQDITSLQTKKAKLKIITPKLASQRKALLRELYLVFDDKLFYITYYVDAGHFFDLLKGKDETQIMVEDRIRKIGQIDRVLSLISRREKLFDDQISDLKSQQQEIAGRMALLAVELSAKQQGLSSLDLRASKIQEYLLRLQHINSLLERDFVSQNSASGETFIFTGGGTEHGIGMSQYGARGLAKLGKNYQEILSYYYQNTHLANKNTASLKIRVGLVLGGAGGKICSLAGSAKVLARTIPENGCANISQNQITIFDASGKNLATITNPGDVTIAPLTAAGVLRVDYKMSGYNEYYGAMQVKNIGGSLYTINIVSFEQYLKGVVPSEMPHSWPAEALKAQAIAARSYAFRAIKPQAVFDVDDTTRFQVYLGKKHQSTETDKAVDETSGQVVVYGAEVIPTYYHSTSGGYTENNENVWGGSPRPYLRAVPSLWEEDSPWWKWSSKVFSRDELSKIFANNAETNVGTLQKIEILNRGISGRVIAIRLTGSAGSVEVTGQTVRKVINANLEVSDPPIRSILFGIKSP